MATEVEVANQMAVCSEQFGYECGNETLVEIDVRSLSTIKPIKPEPKSKIGEISEYHLGPKRTFKEILKDRKTRSPKFIHFNRPEIRDMRSERNQRLFLM